MIDLLLKPQTERQSMIDLQLAANETPIRATHLDHLIDVYLSDCSASVDSATVTSYRHQIAPFRAWWAQAGPPVDHILTARAVEVFPAWVRAEYRNHRGRPPSPASLRSCCVRVRQFTRWLYRTGRLPVDITAWIPLPKKRPQSQRFLTPQQCQDLLEAVPAGPLQYRDRAMIAFLLATGARRFEAANALWADLHIDERGGVVRLRKTKGDNTGQGGGRIVVFGPATAEAIHYHDQFLRLTGQAGDDLRVFGMSNTAIKNRFAKLAERLGWPIGPHDCRRTFADHWWHSHRGGDQAMILLKLQLGHAVGHDVTMAHYIDTTNETRIIELIREAYTGPVEGLRVAPKVGLLNRKA
jgi:integrase